KQAAAGLTFLDIDQINVRQGVEQRAWVALGYPDRNEGAGLADQELAVGRGPLGPGEYRGQAGGREHADGVTAGSERPVHPVHEVVAWTEIPRLNERGIARALQCSGDPGGAVFILAVVGDEEIVLLAIHVGVPSASRVHEGTRRKHHRPFGIKDLRDSR